ncbi:MAG: AraC family transcriptional regulator [Chitinophagaceae bacterium]|nr:MAG: AraC family transcriptional regulator [Chitinophagaceae bacterium]
MSSFLTTIILLGAIQGMVMSALLFSMKLNRVPARSLGWILVLISVASLNIWSWSVESWQQTAWYDLLTSCVPLIVIMPVGPLIWIYTRSTLDPSLLIKRQDKLHFLPVIIDLIAPLTCAVYVISIIITGQNNYHSKIATFIDHYNVYSDIPRWISVTTYSILSLRLLNAEKNSARIENRTEQTRWLRIFLFVFIGFAAIWLCQLIPYVIPVYTEWMLDNIGWYPVYVPLALLMYFLGTRGYLQVKQLRISQRKEPFLQVTSEQVNEQLKVILEKVGTEKIYLDAGLNLSVLSSATKIPSKQISSILNQHLGKSFNEFINEYRVKEVIMRLANPENDKFTIAGIAYECGFNSQPTFQRAFKTVTGKTPSQFIAETGAQKLPETALVFPAPAWAYFVAVL